jgi:hypothetical protein
MGLRVSKQIWMAIVTGAVFVAGAVGWRTLNRHPTNAEIEVCRFVLARQYEDTTSRWHARAHGEEEPPTNEKSDAWSACAPLYAAKACRDAFLPASERDPASRLDGILRACRDEYCPRLHAKPELCTRDATNSIKPSELARMWAQLDDAILEHDLGARSDAIRAERRRGAEEVAAAVAEYLDAGSPPFRGVSGVGVRLVPGSIEPRGPADPVGDSGL